jgi:hypothetical protein
MKDKVVINRRINSNKINTPCKSNRASEKERPIGKKDENIIESNQDKQNKGQGVGGCIERNTPVRKYKYRDERRNRKIIKVKKSTYRRDMRVKGEPVIHSRKKNIKLKKSKYYRNVKKSIGKGNKGGTEKLYVKEYKYGKLYMYKQSGCTLCTVSTVNTSIRYTGGNNNNNNNARKVKCTLCTVIVARGGMRSGHVVNIVLTWVYILTRRVVSGYRCVLTRRKKVLDIKGTPTKMAVNVFWACCWSAGILLKGGMHETVTPDENNISAVTEQVLSETNFQKLRTMSLPIEEGINEDFPPLGQRKGKKIDRTPSFCDTPVPIDLNVIYKSKQRYKRYGE